ncbi:hypothetical protein ATCC90586_010569 [Pythium insidiosum]|nr:hypothetical protein ATCC90586_010569 [Pythium insidiosum]
MSEPQLEERSLKIQDEDAKSPTKAIQEPPAQQELAEPAAEPEAAATVAETADSPVEKTSDGDPTKIDTTPSNEVSARSGRDNVKDAEVGGDRQAEGAGPKQQQGADTQESTDSEREDDDDDSVDAIADAIREVNISHNPNISHSAYHRFDDGSIEVGSGFTTPGMYVARESGIAYDTSCDPPQPCFNCQGNHWRKDCPRRATFSR